MLSFDDIEDSFPDQGAFEDHETGKILVSAQWLHDFARIIEAKVHVMQKDESLHNLHDAVGWRMANLLLLQKCLSNLEYEGTEAEHSKWIGERELAIIELKHACEKYGDLEWNDKLALSDIIEKHLVRHLDDVVDKN